MMKYSPEESASYCDSIVNLATLKAFHDAGVNVRDFPNFITEVSYNDNKSLDIFKEGCKCLFSSCDYYSAYEKEDERFLEILKKDKNLGWLPECYFEFSNEKLQELFQSKKYKKRFLQFFEEIIKALDKHDVNILILSYGGIGLCSYSEIFDNEITQVIISIKTEIDNLYQQLKGEL